MTLSRSDPDAPPPLHTKSLSDYRQFAESPTVCRITVDLDSPNNLLTFLRCAAALQVLQETVREKLGEDELMALVRPTSPPPSY